MFFIGFITDKNSEYNIKNNFKSINKDNNLIFLNNDNIENYKNVCFDSLVLNDKINNSFILNKILKKSKYILCNTDINFNNVVDSICSNLITFGYNSKANVTISSVTDDDFLLFIQNNINPNLNIEGMQEIRFNKTRNNVSAYDSMIITVLNQLYNGKNNM